MLEDAGPIIPYAKKHLAVDRGPKLQDGVGLDDLWPPPDWEAVVRSGMSVDVAAMIAMVRAGLGTKPKVGTGFDISDEQWSEAYIQAIPIIRDILMSSLSVLEASRLNSRLATHLGTTLRDLGRQAPKNYLLFWATGRGTTRIHSPGRLTLRQKAMAKWLSRMGWPQSDVALKASVVPILLTDGTWRVVKVDGNRYSVTLDTVFENEAQALSAAIAYSNSRVAGSFKPRKPSNARFMQRIGPDHRNGRLISTTDLMEEFGLTSVQFGNSLGARERQLWMNEIFDALADLADVLSIPRGWVGLGGVSLAIGARGNAGSAAHFEPALNAINLTRNNGAGTLAHEWWHVAACRLCKNIAKYCGYISLFVYMRPLFEVELSPRSEAIVEKIEEISSYITQSSEYAGAAQRICHSGASGKDWANPEELFARAFEAYIQDTLLEAGRVSPWLSYGTLEADYNLDVVAASPYPSGVERLNLKLLFKNLMRLLFDHTEK